MKKVFIIVFLLLLGCSKNILNEKNIYNCFFSDGEKLIVSKKTTINIFWEWGEILITYDDLFLRKGVDSKIVENAITNGGSIRERRPGFCENNGNLPQRVFRSENGTLNAECFWKLEKTNHYDKSIVERKFGDAFLRRVVVDVVDDEYYVYYTGDSLFAEPNPNFVHRKINGDERTRVRLLNKDEILEKDENYMYAFIFSMNTPVYSISIWSDLKNSLEYEPLRLDASILPLESPDYKKMREYESSLTHGK